MLFQDSLAMSAVNKRNKKINTIDIFLNITLEKVNPVKVLLLLR